MSHSWEQFEIDYIYFSTEYVFKTQLKKHLIYSAK